MENPRSRQIVIAGAGIAGLTAAIAFAARGFAVRVFEQAPQLAEVGAGLQLSPNATRILRQLGVMEHLAAGAVRAESVTILSAKRQSELARVPLGEAADKRWGAPYLVAHRADLQTALLARARRDPDIEIVTGARVADAALHARGATVSIDRGGRIDEVSCLLLVGADGVWSSVRALGNGKPANRHTGQAAWRATVQTESEAGRRFAKIMPADRVSVFAHPRFHLVAYPVRGGTAINLAVLAPTPEGAERSAAPDLAPLRRATRGLKGPLKDFTASVGAWTLWPLHEVDPELGWTGDKGVVLIGDAAHAMTPFAAQGAAMAIEDAATLAEIVAARAPDQPGAQAIWEKLRRRRVERVAKRGRFNHFTWNARGLVAMARNIVLSMRRPEALMRDFDWLYGHDAVKAAKDAVAPPPKKG